MGCKTVIKSNEHFIKIKVSYSYVKDFLFVFAWAMCLEYLLL